MLSTTLRIQDDLASYLQQAANEEAMSVNAYLTRLLEQDRQAARKRRLARDWAAYAAQGEAQEVDFALAAQAELAAEPAVPYRVTGRKGKAK